MRILSFLTGVLLIAAPFAWPIYQFEYEATQGQLVIWAPAYVLGVLVVGLPLWMRQVHHVKQPWPVLGIAGGLSWWCHWLLAFAVGVTGVVGLYALQIVFSWGTWVPLTSQELSGHILEGFGVGLGVGLAEEIVFRGWLLFELEQDYSPQKALWFNAGCFAIAHYFRPLSAILETWPQFFGLLLLGLTLVWARRIPILANRATTKTTLGFAAGLHSGLVFTYYQFDVGNLVLATGRAPEWITGIGGNPLAGVSGLLLLGAIGSATFVASHSR